MMRLLFFFIGISLFISSCQSRKKKTVDLNKAIVGDWLILYPKHELTSGEQRKIYGVAQDSIIALTGLKMVSFRDREIFLQTDSIFKPPGKWHFNTDDKKIFIRNAGKGFDFFEGLVIGLDNDTLRIVENILLSGHTIRLVWHLKRITDKKTLSLFSKEKNEWRKETGTETDSLLRKKVKSMLLYYSLYYEMVSEESAYFSPAKVFLPFRYYQHGMGLRPFSDETNFKLFFNNNDQAKRAHGILKQAMDAVEENSFPSGKNYVIEYSRFMTKLAGVIK